MNAPFVRLTRIKKGLQASGNRMMPPQSTGVAGDCRIALERQGIPRKVPKCRLCEGKSEVVWRAQSPWEDCAGAAASHIGHCRSARYHCTLRWQPVPLRYLESPNFSGCMQVMLPVCSRDQQLDIHDIAVCGASPIRSSVSGSAK